MQSILIIDDEASLAASLSFALEEEGFKVRCAFTGEAGVRELTAEPADLVLLDLRLPDIDGLAVLKRIGDSASPPPVIMISAHGDTRAAVRAIKLGAADYLTKPFDLDELLHVLRSALERSRMQSELSFHRRAVLRDPGLLGGSPPMRALSQMIGRVAGSSTARILILGESGTGKALVARGIHAASQRADGPFIEINCASLPEQLIEAELFGAEKGSYTGAHQKRVGLVALADKGTLFLDEIGELPLPLQAKLLHFLENSQYRPIGSGRNLSADVRVVAATNRDLAMEAAAGRFREDLYYRLNVIRIEVPPLSARGDDIVHLAEHFAARSAQEEHVQPIRLTAEAGRHLAAYRWPGNVRELKNLIERLTILYPGREIGTGELPPEMVASAPVEAPAALPAEPDRNAAAAASIGDTLADAERTLILDALHECNGHKTHAADRLGISRHAFKRRLKRLGIG